MTSVKRRIVAFVGAALMAGTMAVGASAYPTYYPFNSIQGDIQGNPLTVSAGSVGTYSNMVANVTTTKVSSTTAGNNNGYAGSKKRAVFEVYGYSNGAFYKITDDCRSKTATTSSVSSPLVTSNDPDEWARRKQTGWLYATSTSNTVVEKHYCRITKAGL